MSTWLIAFLMYPVSYALLGIYLEFWPWTADQMLGWANYKGWLFPQRDSLDANDDWRR